MLSFAPILLSLAIAANGNIDLFPQRMSPGAVGALGDFNGDGLIDRIAPSATAATVSIYLGDGAGGFAQLPAIALPAQMFHPAVADIDGDGNDDAIGDMLFQLPGVAFCVVHGSASGPFTVSLIPGVSASGLGVGEFTGDGVLDVMGTDYVNILTFAGDGLGGFTLASTVPQPLSGALWTFGSADLDADGDEDATGRTYTPVGPHGIGLVENRGGGLLSASVFATNLPGFEQNVGAIGDFDGDGRGDVVAYDDGYPGPFANIALLLSTGPGMTFVAKEIVPAKTIFEDAEQAFIHGAADFDADGNPELVVGTNGAKGWNLAVLKYETSPMGFGTFATRPYRGSPTGRVADFDSDGKWDLVIDQDSPRCLVMRDVLTLDPDAQFLPPTSSFFPVLACADFDLDGDIDIASTSANPFDVALHVNSAGALAPETVVCSFTTGVLAMRASDIDADGKPDLVVRTSGFVAPLRGDGHGGFTLMAQFVPAKAVAADRMAFADVDGDGFGDVAAMTTTNGFGALNAAVYLGSPLGFTKGSILLSSDAAIDVGLGDVNGDGLMDGAVLKSFGPSGPGSVIVSIASSPGVFGSTLSVATAFQPTGMALGDFDADGRSDVAVISTIDQKIEVFRSTGAALVLQSTLPIAQAASQNTPIEAVDITQDGWLDLIVRGANDHSISIFAGAYDGTFTAVGEYAAFGRDHKVVDFDGDGRLDLVSVAFDAHILVLRRKAGALGVEVFGGGKAGTNGQPTLGVLGAPVLGAPFGIRIDHGLAGAMPALFLGVQRVAMPFDGGTLNVLPLATLILPPLSPNGRLDVPVLLPAVPAFSGLAFDLQGAFVDPGAAGFLHTAQTRGLEIVLGS